MHAWNQQPTIGCCIRSEQQRIVQRRFTFYGRQESAISTQGQTRLSTNTEPQKVGTVPYLEEDQGQRLARLAIA